MALGNRLRVDVYDASGVLLAAGPLFHATGFDYTLTLDRVGAFKLDLPATDTRASLFTQGNEVRVYFEGEGLVFRGIVDHCDFKPQANGSIGMTVTGGSIGRQLVFANSLLGRTYNIVTLANFMLASGAGILAGTGWAPGTLDVPTTNLLARFDGVSISECINKAATQFRLHWRENILVKTIDVGAFGTNPNGLIFQNIEMMSPNMAAANANLYPISNLTIVEESPDLWNKIVALGAGDGINQLTLRYSDRTTGAGFPYNVQTATGPDGVTPYYFLRDATSATAYTERVKILSVKDAIPLANSPAGFTAAANALYDIAATWLQRHKDPQFIYDVTVENLRNLDGSGNPLFRVGDKVTLNYNGVVTDKAGVRSAWKTIAASVTILSVTRTFKQDGSWAWRIQVSNVDRLRDSIEQTLTTVFNNVWALNVSPSPYTYREIHNMTRRSLDSVHDAVMVANFDANIAYMHQAKLTFQITALRGLQTVTNIASIGTTTATAHSHAIAGSGSTSDASGSTFTNFTVPNSVNLAGLGTGSPSVASTGGQSASHTHLENGAGLQTDLDSVNHDHSLAGHTHTISNHNHGLTGSTSGNLSIPTHVHNQQGTTGPESAHTHGINNHNHGNTGAAFGLLDEATPSLPAVAVTCNGVAITGSPFNTVGSDIVVDVSAQIQNGIGQIAAAMNTIIFHIPGAQLIDIEATLRSLVTATSLTPV